MFFNSHIMCSLVGKESKCFLEYNILLNNCSIYLSGIADNLGQYSLCIYCYLRGNNRFSTSCTTSKAVHLNTDTMSSVMDSECIRIYYQDNIHWNIACISFDLCKYNNLSCNYNNGYPYNKMTTYTTSIAPLHSKVSDCTIHNRLHYILHSDCY